MAKQIPVSFKEHELDLYNYVKSKSSPSIYIKELIEQDRNKSGNAITLKDELKEEVKEKPKQNNMNLSALKMGK